MSERKVSKIKLLSKYLVSKYLIQEKDQEKFYLVTFILEFS